MSKTLDAFRKVVKDVRSGTFKPLYLLHGDEGYFIDRIGEEIEAHALQEHERDFNLTVLYGKDSDPDQVRDACLRFPMMAERQLVVLREAQTWKIDQFDKLAAYFKKPTPTTVLVIQVKHKKLDGRRAWFKDLKKHAVIFESKKLYDNEMPGWIQGYVKFQKRRIGEREALLLAEHLGSDLARLTKQVEKLCIMAGEGEAITGDLIERIIGINKDYNIFELQNAIGANNAEKAQRIANYFASAPKDHPLVLTVGMLNAFFTKVALVHAGQGRSQGELASLLGVSPFFVKDYANAARNFPPDRLAEVQRLLRDTDLKTKGVGSSSATDGDLLRELLAKVMTPGRLN